MSIDYLTGTPPVAGRVTPLVSGRAYFNDFGGSLDNLKAGDSLYLLNWHLHPYQFFAQPPVNGQPQWIHLSTVLQNLVQAGVDVRILLWVNSNLFEPLYPVTHSGQIDLQLGDTDLLDRAQDLTDWAAPRVLPDVLGSLYDVNELNLRTAHEWRHSRYDTDGPHPNPLEPGKTADDTLANRLMINTLDSALGGCHTKFALFLIRNPATSLHEGYAYSGGIDISPDRFAGPPYTGYLTPEGRARMNYWHDLMVRVEGPAAISEMHAYFRNLWNENLSRIDSYNPDVYAELDDGLVPVPCIPAGAEPVPTAPDLGGVYSDNLLQSVITVPDTLQLLGSDDNPLIGEPAISAYPDGEFSYRDAVYHLFERAEHYLYIEDQAMESLELWGLVAQALKQKDQLRVILLTGSDLADSPVPVRRKLIRWRWFDRLDANERARLFLYDANYTIHSKLFLADDVAAIAGSGGFFTRSLTEELEHGVAWIDTQQPGIANLRRQLWEVHAGIDASAWQDALSLWGPDLLSGDPGDNNPEHPFLTRVDLSLDAFKLIEADEVDWTSVPELLLRKAAGDELDATEADALELFTRFHLEKAEVALHLATRELPFLSLFNPRQRTPELAQPDMQRDRVAVNQKTQLALHCEAGSTVTWSLQSGNGTLTASSDGRNCEAQFSAPGVAIVIARQTLPDGAALDYPFVIRVLENSGVQWVARYPGSRLLSMLSSEFRTRVEAMIMSLASVDFFNGQTVEDFVISTYRPPQRALLMHGSWAISSGSKAPEDFEKSLPDVPVSWVHYTADGEPDPDASVAAATAMFEAYGISGRAVYPSRHSEGNAVDMVLAISQAVFAPLPDGTTMPIAGQQDLKEYGAYFGVHRLRMGNHWSRDGH